MEIETLIATDRDQGSGGTVEYILEEPVSYIPSLEPLSVTVWSGNLPYRFMAHLPLGYTLES